MRLILVAPWIWLPMDGGSLCAEPQCRSPRLPQPWAGPGAPRLWNPPWVQSPAPLFKAIYGAGVVVVITAGPPRMVPSTPRTGTSTPVLKELYWVPLIPHGTQPLTHRSPLSPWPRLLWLLWGREVNSGIGEWNRVWGQCEV